MQRSKGRSEQDRVRGGGGERTGARKEYNHAACLHSPASCRTSSGTSVAIIMLFH